MEEIHGRWRQAGASAATAVSGVLAIDDKRLRLTLHELLPVTDDKDLIILGESRERGQVTLLGVHVLMREHTSHYGAGISKASATQVLIGTHLENPRAALFDQIQVEVENLLALRNESGWTRDVEFGQDRYGLEWKPVPKLSCTTPRGALDLTIWMREHSRPRITHGDYRVGEVGYFNLQLDEPMTLDAALDLWFRPLIDFTSFAAGTACAATSVQVSGPDFQERGYPVWIEVRSHWVNDNDNEPLEFWQTRFNLPDNNDEFGSLINNWLEVWDAAARPLGGFFVNEWDRTTFMENRFLTAAVALEGYNRRTTGRKVNFGTRISESCDRAASLIDPLVDDELVKRVVRVRNALVHDSDDREKDIPDGSGLRCLADTLQLVMSICVAKDVGIEAALNEEPLRSTIRWLDELRQATAWPALRTKADS